MLGVDQRPAVVPASSERAPRRRWVAAWPWALLAFALILGAGLRLYGINWDQGAHLHPDEREIIMVVGGIHLPTAADAATAAQRDGHGPLDPHFFAYGSLPLYLLAVAGNLAHRLGLLLSVVGLHSRALTQVLIAGDGYDGMALVGRFLSALFDTASIGLCFLIGRRLYGVAAGAVAAFLYAVTALAVQQAHFYVVDPILTFFVLLTLLFSLRSLQEGRTGDALLSGVFYGAAVATKVSAAPLGLVVLLAQALPVWRARATLDGLQWRALLGARVDRLLLAGVAAAATFVCTEPYAILDWKQFSKDLAEQSAMVRGVADFPYTRQYAPTKPYLYWFEGLLTWQMTPPLALAGLFGLGWQAWRAVQSRFDAEKLLVAWWLPYLLLTGAFYAKFPRYMLPAAPFFAIGAGGLLWAIAGGKFGAASVANGGKHAKATPPAPALPRALAIALLVLVLAVPAFYSLAYEHIYATTNTRLAASDWIYQHIPATTDGHQTVLTHEVWDDGLPLDRTNQQPGWVAGRYGYADLPIYDDETVQKQQTIITDLQHADYVVESSEIVRGSILRNPQRYPMTIAYYAALADGSLGFEQVASFHSVPSLFGLRFDDRASDLNWQFYDHPPVTIYRKVRAVSPAQMAALFPVPAAPPPALATAGHPSLNLTPQAQAADSQAPSLGEMFPLNGLGMRFPLPVWLLTVEIIGLLALPWSIRLLRALPDAGYSAGKALGLLLTGWATWILASIGLAHFTQRTIVLVLAGMLAAAVVGWWTLDGARDLVRRKWRLWLVSEGVFLAAFGLFLLIRAFNPDLWQLYHGGERPMELSYIHAILRSQTLPPFDPWLSGTTINYYYFGFFLLSTLFKLTRIAPETGFNLALPTIYGLAMQLAAAAGYALTGLLLARSWAVRPEARDDGAASFSPGEDGPATEVAPTNERSRPTPTRTARAGGLRSWLGATFVAGHPPLESATVTGRATPERLDRWGAFGGLAALLLYGILGNQDTGPYLLGELQQVGAKVIPNAAPLVGGAVQVVAGLWETIVTGGNALPAFNFFDRTRVIPNTINEFPFFSFLYGDLHPHVLDMPFELLAVCFALALIAGSRRLRNVPITAVTVLLGGLLLGALWPTNVWDYPTFLLLVAGALAIRFFDGRSLRAVLLPTIGVVVALAVVGRFAFFPFYQHFYALDSGIGIPMHHSDIWSFVRVYGLFFFIAGSALLLEQRLRLERLALLLLPAVLAGLVSGSATIALLIGMLTLLLRAAWRRRFRPNILAAFLLLALALCVVLGTELIFIKDPLAGGDAQRMNTVFKFGVQAWILLSVACGPLFVWLLHYRPVRALVGRRRVAAQAAAMADGAAAPAEVVRADGTVASASLANGNGAVPATLPMSLRPATVTAAVTVAPVSASLDVGASGESDSVTRSEDGAESSAAAAADGVDEAAGLVNGEDNGRADAALGGPATEVAPAVERSPAFAGLSAQPAEAGFALLGAALAAGPTAPVRSRAASHVYGRALGRWWPAVLAVLVFSAALYPVLATPAHEVDRWAPHNAPTPSLDGMAFMRENYPSDYAAITWLQQHVAGDPVLIEANKDIYAWYGRVSWFTGLPTVLGWDYHTSQFHDPALIPVRKQDINTIYTTADPVLALQLLRQYHVSLIYVGPLEQQTYGAAATGSVAGLAKFDAMVGTTLNLLYSADGVKIYQVRSAG